MADNDQDWPPEPKRLHPVVVSEPQSTRGWNIFDGCLQIVGAGAVSAIVGAIASIPWARDQASNIHSVNPSHSDMDFGAAFGAIVVLPFLVLCAGIAFGLLGALSRSAWLCAEHGRLKAAAVQAILPGALLILVELIRCFFDETWDQFVDQLSSAWLPILWIGLLFAKGVRVIRVIYAEKSEASR